MKKLSLICALIISLSSQAFAKTEGSYVGVNIANNSAEHDMKVSPNFIQINAQNNFEKNSTGFGLEYKYAYNFNNLFIAPGVFFDFFRNEAQNLNNDDINIENRYGVKIDIGYDIADKVAPYLTFGYGKVSYENSVNRTVNGNLTLTAVSGSETSSIFGLGILFDLNENVKFNVEANYQAIDIPLSSAVGYEKSETEISSVKFGVLFNF